MDGRPQLFGHLLRILALALAPWIAIAGLSHWLFPNSRSMISDICWISSSRSV